MEKKNPLHSFVNIKERKCITLDGVINVEKFDDKGVMLLSDVGRIEIDGSDLKIISLEKDGGVINVSGRIYGVFYEREKNTEGILKRLFG